MYDLHASSHFYWFDSRTPRHNTVRLSVNPPIHCQGPRGLNPPQRTPERLYPLLQRTTALASTNTRPIVVQPRPWAYTAPATSSSTRRPLNQISLMYVIHALGRFSPGLLPPAPFLCASVSLVLVLCVLGLVVRGQVLGHVQRQQHRRHHHQRSQRVGQVSELTHHVHAEKGREPRSSAEPGYGPSCVTRRRERDVPASCPCPTCSSRPSPPPALHHTPPPADTPSQTLMANKNNMLRAWTTKSVPPT